MKLFSIIFITSTLYCTQAFSQSHDTSQALTFTIQQRAILKVTSSRSNTLYMGMPNVVKIQHIDSTNTNYVMYSGYGPVAKSGKATFTVYALRPGPLKLSLYRKSGHDSTKIDAEIFTVKELPESRLALAGKAIDYAVSNTMLLTVQKLEILPDTDILSTSWLHVSSFNLSVAGRTYASVTDKLTDDMIKALRDIKGQRINPTTKKEYTIDFTNILVAGNGTLETLKNIIGIIMVN
jgi:hypothetical protein